MIVQIRFVVLCQIIGVMFLVLCHMVGVTVYGSLRIMGIIFGVLHNRVAVIVLVRILCQIT